MCRLLSALFLLSCLVFASEAGAQNSGAGRFDNQIPTSILDSVDTAASQAAQVVSEVRIDALPVSYQEGKVLETYVSVTTKSLANVRAALSNARGNSSLLSQLQLLISFRSLDDGIGGLSMELASTLSDSDVSSAKRSDWAKALSNAQTPLVDALLKLQPVVMQHVREADERLQKCSPQSPAS